jgi:hypothetical protein
MKIRKGFYIISYDNTLFLSKVTRAVDGSYWRNDLENLNNCRSEITYDWEVEAVEEVEWLEYGRTIESLKKKCPQYFV